MVDGSGNFSSFEKDTENDFEYNSRNNSEWLSAKELAKLIESFSPGQYW